MSTFVGLRDTTYQERGQGGWRERQRRRAFRSAKEWKGGARDEGVGNEGGVGRLILLPTNFNVIETSDHSQTVAHYWVRSYEVVFKKVTVKGVTVQ